MGCGKKELRAFSFMCSVVKFAIGMDLDAPIAVPLFCLKIAPLYEKYVLDKQNSSRRQSLSTVRGVLSFNKLALFLRGARTEGTGTLVNKDNKSNENRLSSSSMFVIFLFESCYCISQLYLSAPTRQISVKHLPSSHSIFSIENCTGVKVHLTRYNLQT